jgi:peroxiredoxin
MILLVAAGLALTSITASAGPPPDFRLKDLDGNWFSLSENLGDGVVYVSFWATWCVPCRREMPHLEKLYQDFKDDGLKIVGVNTDPPGTTSKIKPFVNRYKLTYTQVLDPDNNVLDKYNPTRELPYAVLIDRSGNVREIFPGYRKGDEVLLREKIEALLAAGEGAETGDAD